MLGSRVCWQLLLGWVLLLGQPVFGDAGSRSSEQRSSQEAEQPAVVSEEPEDPLTEEPENQEPVEKEPKEKKPPSDEELDEMEKEERKWLSREKKKPCGSWLQHLQAIALGHYNKKKDVYYKQHGGATLISLLHRDPMKLLIPREYNFGASYVGAPMNGVFKNDADHSGEEEGQAGGEELTRCLCRKEWHHSDLKAIGTIIHFKVVLQKTNCTKDQMPKDMHQFYMYHYRQRYLENCEPLKGSETECTFTLFVNERSQYNQNDFISEKCHLMYPYEKTDQKPRITFRS